MGRLHRVGAGDVIVTVHATPRVQDVQRNPEKFNNMLSMRGYGSVESRTMRIVDDTDRRLLLAMTENPRSTIVSLAERLSLSRNTVQSRLAALEAGQVLQGYDRRLHAASLGYPLTAFMETQVDQPRLEQVIAQLREIPEVVQVHGLSGLHDILVRCVCRDTDDLYRVNKLILGCEGVIRTDTSLAMGELIPFRLAPVLERDIGR